MSNPIGIITTINAPTASVKKIASLIPVIAIGDTKTPSDWKCDNVKYVGINEQLDFTLDLPFNHYARKNYGYLLAMQYGATSIFDSDDDNSPTYNWEIREQKCKVLDVKKEGWCNVYSFFTNVKVWPRGFSLRNVNERVSYLLPDETERGCPIQQGLADGAPDVDAIWRLTQNENVSFNIKRSLWLGENVWCPFNSQVTWWFPEAYPLMYLPVYATFRMTDIWRSFVAQRCLWKMGKGIVFHSPSEVYQDRNPHDLIKDFEDEVDGYLNNHKIVEALTKLELGENIFDNMVLCYYELVELGVLPEKELKHLNQWMNDVEKVWKH